MEFKWELVNRKEDEFLCHVGHPGHGELKLVPRQPNVDHLR